MPVSGEICGLVAIMVATSGMAWVSLPIAGISLVINGEWSFIFFGLGGAIVLPLIYAIGSTPNMGVAFASGPRKPVR